MALSHEQAFVLAFRAELDEEALELRSLRESAPHRDEEER